MVFNRNEANSQKYRQFSSGTLTKLAIKRDLKQGIL